MRLGRISKAVGVAAAAAIALSACAGNSGGTTPSTAASAGKQGGSATVVEVNAFNTFDLCGCGGASVFVNGGGSNLSTIGQAVLTNSTTASLARFNPFTTTPVEGVNWNYGPNFGTATNRQAYTSPRTFRLTFGIRF